MQPLQAPPAPLPSPSRARSAERATVDDMDIERTALELRSLSLPALRQRQLTLEAAHAPTDAARALLVARARHEARKRTEEHTAAVRADLRARAEWVAKNPPVMNSDCPDTHPHGENGGCYRKHGCRCAACVTAQRGRIIAWKLEQREQTLRPVHVSHTTPKRPDIVRPERRAEEVGANRTPKAKEVPEEIQALVEVVEPANPAQTREFKHGLQGYNKYKCRCWTCKDAKRASRVPKNPRHEKTEEVAHGTLTSYVKAKCRCELCRAASSAYNKARYAEKKAQKAEITA